jgi:hypothetical protein
VLYLCLCVCAAKLVAENTLVHSEVTIDRLTLQIKCKYTVGIDNVAVECAINESLQCLLSWLVSCQWL